MSLQEQFVKLKNLVETSENEIKSLEAGRKASAPRVRKALQQIKTISHDLRKSITEHVNSMPVKSRGKKTEEE